MNIITRGIRNAFRNAIRTLAIVGMLSLSIGLSLSMLLAHQAVGQKITGIQQGIGNTITIAPAGIRGFLGGGNALTAQQLAAVLHTSHVTGMDTTLSDRLAGDDTNLAPAVEAGTFGQRQFGIDRRATGNVQIMPGSGSAAPDFSNFKLPIPVIGASKPLAAETASAGGSLTLTSGTSFDGTKDAAVALVGKTLAAKNNLQAGSTFTAYGTTLTVSGLFDAGNNFTNNQIIMPLPTVQRLSQQNGSVTGASVHIDSAANLDATTAAIQKILGDKADVSNDAAPTKTTLGSLAGIQRVSLFSLVGAAATAAVIILLTMIMIVRERRREIGVLKAIGGSNIRVMAQFTVEAITLTVLAAAIGCIIGAIGATPVTKLLANYASGDTATSQSSDTPAGGSSLMVGNSDGSQRVRSGGLRQQFGRRSVEEGVRNLRANVNGRILVYSFGVAVLIAIIGSTAAAGLIAKVRPAEVMRGE